MRFLVFVSVLFFSTVSNAQTWVYAPSITTATYDPVSATTTYRQCLCNCYETGRCVCHPYWIRTWKTYNVPEKTRRGIVTTFDFINRIVKAPFTEPIHVRPLFFRPVPPRRRDRLPAVKLH